MNWSNYSGTYYRLFDATSGVAEFLNNDNELLFSMADASDSVITVFVVD